MINLDALDQYGTPWRRSLIPDAEMVLLFHSLGLTVGEARELRKDRKLPDFVLEIWDEYDALNKARFNYDQR